MKGEVVYLYAFDVANEIITGKVKEVLASTPVPFEIRADHTLPKDIPLYKPLAIEHSPLSAALAGMQVRPLIHVYDVGVVSIAMRIAFDVKSLADLMPLHNIQLANGQRLEHAARDLCIEACKSLEKAMIQAAPLPEPEAYTIFCLTDIGAKQPLDAWMAEHRQDIAALLTENKPGILSEMQVAEVLRIHRSYAHTDLTIIDWDAALTIDLTGYVEDTLYVLELANLQLEEYRVMDQRLDRYLNKAYEDIQPRKFQLFGKYPAILRSLRTLRVDVTKLNDEITHITKFFGDWYLARVYLGARDRFHLNQWRNSVEERLKQIDALYTVAHTEISNQRMFWLEMLIAIFFAIDLLSIFLLKK
ncbi:MAG: hypothetical protein KGJ06_04355 [Pseudomonadota bacterium]|nr:hypothetical protein [Pseudomonadota bacterium]